MQWQPWWPRRLEQKAAVAHCGAYPQPILCFPGSHGHALQGWCTLCGPSPIGSLQACSISSSCSRELAARTPIHHLHLHSHPLHMQFNQFSLTRMPARCQCHLSLLKSTVMSRPRAASARAMATQTPHACNKILQCQRISSNCQCCSAHAAILHCKIQTGNWYPASTLLLYNWL